MMVINIECVTDVDKQREIIIFDSILTSYKPSIDFLFVFLGGSLGNFKNSLEPSNKLP